MRLALLALGGFCVAAAATVAVRWPAEPEVVELKGEPVKTATRTRVRLVRGDCPAGLEGFDAQAKDLNDERVRVMKETVGLSNRLESIGEAWPEALNAGFEPETVEAAVSALLPDDSVVEWRCDHVPCTAMIVLPDADEAGAAELRAALESAYPGSTGEPWGVDREAYSADGDAVVGQALVLQAMPELTEDSHKARAYYVQRNPRKAVREAMRVRLME